MIKKPRKKQDNRMVNKPNFNVFNSYRQLWYLPDDIKAPVKWFTREEIEEYESKLKEDS